MNDEQIAIIVASSLYIAVMIIVIIYITKGLKKSNDLPLLKNSNCEVIRNMEIDLEGVYEYDVDIKRLRHLSKTAFLNVERKRIIHRDSCQTGKKINYVKNENLSNGNFNVENIRGILDNKPSNVPSGEVSKKDRQINVKIK